MSPLRLGGIRGRLHFYIIIAAAEGYDWLF
jgi:hypothetical protein